MLVRFMFYDWLPPVGEIKLINIRLLGLTGRQVGHLQSKILRMSMPTLPTTR